MFPTAKEVFNAFNVRYSAYKMVDLAAFEKFLANSANMRLMIEQGIDTAEKVADYFYRVYYNDAGAGIYC